MYLAGAKASVSFLFLEGSHRTKTAVSNCESSANVSPQGKRRIEEDRSQNLLESLLKANSIRVPRRAHSSVG